MTGSFLGVAKDGQTKITLYQYQSTETATYVPIPFSMHNCNNTVFVKLFSPQNPFGSQKYR